MALVKPTADKRGLERLYRLFNHRRFIEPDPLLFLYRYSRIEDRELVGLLAASLAFGRVAQIGTSVERVLAVLGPAPHAFLLAAEPAALENAFAAFRHRYASGRDLAALLAGMRRVLLRHGSLNRAFTARLAPRAPTVLPALGAFVEAFGCGRNCLLPHPGQGSACKRLHLFLRWMVRRDDVDPGGWTGVDPRQLLVPLDTHMARHARQLGLTRRRTANRAMALEVTAAFRRWSPGDPVKYDFALTRLGIRPALLPPARSPAHHAVASIRTPVRKSST